MLHDDAGENADDNQVAAIFTKALGYSVEHVKLTQEESKQRYMKFNGMSEKFATFLAWIEKTTADGAEEKWSGNDVELLTGRPPMTLESWIQENKSTWVS